MIHHRIEWARSSFKLAYDMWRIVSATVDRTNLVFVSNFGDGIVEKIFHFVDHIVPLLTAETFAELSKVFSFLRDSHIYAFPDILVCIIIAVIDDCLKSYVQLAFVLDITVDVRVEFYAF